MPLSDGDSTTPYGSDEQGSVEEALRRSEERYRIVADSTYDWEFWLSPEGQFLYCSPSCLRVTGYAAAEFEADQGLLLRLIAPEDREYYLAHECRSERAPGRAEFRVIDRAGAVHWIEHLCQPVFAADGTYRGSRGSNRDITERKTAEEERERLLLALDEARTSAEAAAAQARAYAAELNVMLEAIGDCVWVHDRDGRIVRRNRASIETLPYPAEMSEATIEERSRLLRPETWDGAPIAPEALPAARALRGETVQSLLMALHPPGAPPVYASATAAPLLDEGGEVTGAVVTMASQSELRAAQERLLAAQKQAEAAAAAANARADELDTVFATAPDGLVLYDAEGIPLRANASARALMAMPDDFWLQTLERRAEAVRAVDADGRPLASEALPTRRALRGERVNGQLIALHLANGGVRWVLSSAVPIARPGGEVQGVVTAFKDVTELRLSQLALEGTNAQLEAVIAAIPDGLVHYDGEGRIVRLNAAAEAMTGWAESDALGRPVSEVLAIRDERTGEPIADPVAAALASGRARSLTSHLALVARDGTRRLLSLSAAAIREGAGSVAGVVLVFQDVTERRFLDDERAKVNKLESLGVLAGGIAHDFNNLLTGIMGNVVLARVEVEDRPYVCELLAEAEQASTRAKALTQQLLTFARGGEPVKRLVALPRLLQDAATFALRGSTVTLRLGLGADLWPVQADPGQLGQVIHNLAINARDAMPGGGQVEVSAANTIVSEADALPLPPGPYVRITVADEGHGVPSELRSRIFDPYFTTKSGGSGLGLAVVYSVVVKHEGYVTLESEVGRGSRFHVYLPAANTGATQTPAPVPESERRARILVMDDEEIVLRVARRMLERLGYEVVVVPGGSEAIAEYVQARDLGRPFAAAILDLHVPGGIGGTETVARLRAIEPRVRCIVSSGYSSDRAMAQYSNYGFVAAIDKPYTMETLAATMSAVLSPAGG